MNSSTVRQEWNKDTILNTLGDEELNVVYMATLAKMAREILVEITDAMDDSPERDKLSGLEVLMGIMSDKLLSTWDNLGLLSGILRFGKECSEIEPAKVEGQA